MKIFVCGRTRSGKTPFARRVAAALGVPHLGASAWVRERFPGAPPPSGAPDEERAAFAAAISRFAVAELRRDPAVSVDHLRARADLTRPCVIEGMRNPYDFVSCFDPREDVAVFLAHAGGGLPATPFERGLDVIRDYLGWLEGAGLLGAPPQRYDYRFARFGDEGGALEPGDAARASTAEATLEDAIVDFVARVTAPVRSRVHAQVAPIATHVRAEFLHGMAPEYAGQLRRCTVFAVSSYLGATPTFQVLLEDGAVFAYVPAHALVDTTLAPAGVCDPALELADLVYHDARSTDICVQDFAALRGPVLCLFKHRDLWLAGRYLFTIDWYSGNELLHAIALANGQYALLPNHKVKFGDHPPGFAPYKKMRREWSVGDGGGE